MRRVFGFWIFIFAGAPTLFGASVADAANPSAGVVAEATSTASAPTFVHRMNFNDAGIRDEAAMVLVGTILIGLAGAVRRVA